MQIRSVNWRSAAFLAIALGLAVVGGMLYFDRFGSGRVADCETYPLQLVVSPSGRRQARQEQEACGSTDELHTRVLLGETGQAQALTVFSSVTGKALGSSAIGQRSLPLTLRWDGDDRLLIGYPAGVASQLPAGLYGGVDVRFEVAPMGAKPATVRK